MSAHQAGFAAAHKVLELVPEGRMELTHLEKKANEIKQLMDVQAAMMGEAGEDTWEAMERHFPEHTDRDQLVSMFGKVQYSKFSYAYNTIDQINVR